MNEFQERLQELLKEYKLSRLELSKKLNISSTTINDYFNKGYYPELTIAIKMAEYFNCSLNYLFGLSDDKSNTNKNKNEFFVNFDKLIKENKLKIARVLREMQMGEYNYYRWKSGQIPKTINLISIAKYFDVSVDYLVGRSF